MAETLWLLLAIVMGVLATTGYALADGDTISVRDFQAQLEVGGRGKPDGVEELLERIRLGRQSFWQAVYEPFMRRDLNRSQVKSLVKAGLDGCGSSYLVTKPEQAAAGATFSHGPLTNGGGGFDDAPSERPHASGGHG